MPSRITEVKCKICRKVLFTEEATPLLTAHGETRTAEPHNRCGTNIPEFCLYISPKNMPDWLNNVIVKEYWTKGRIHCPECNSRIGSFNFVSSMKCDCGMSIVPPIRIAHGKVNRLYDKNNEQRQQAVFRVPARQNPDRLMENPEFQLFLHQAVMNRQEVSLEFSR